MRRTVITRAFSSAAIFARQESCATASFSGRVEDQILPWALSTSRGLHTVNIAGQREAGSHFDRTLLLPSPQAGWQALSFSSNVKRLTVKTTTKSHRFSHHIKIDRELELRKYWQEERGVENLAHLQRYINFSRIYARFRDLGYLQHTMRDWDAAIDRLFNHDRGKQPANDLVRRHPYVLNVKILPLQFAKNAVKGKLPLYDWRKVLRDLRLSVGEELPERDRQRQPSDTQKPFNHAKRTTAAIKRVTEVPV